jgi:CRP/FNR family transcriptional regulator, cyclic AMP receptor protein
MAAESQIVQPAAEAKAIRVADYDPDLFADLGEQKGQAERLALARQVRLAPGEWRLGEQTGQGPLGLIRDQRGSLGLLILEGLFWREASVGSEAGIELLGPGDLLRPWVKPIPTSEILAEDRWTVLQPSSLAILDRRFAIAMARWPTVAATLMDRLILRTRWLSFQLAICHVRNLRQRLLLAMWHFGDRWGRMSPDGVIVPVRLPHRMLAQLVGARRPSVTTALASLRSEGLLDERDDGSWLLPKEIPQELRAAYEQASSAAGIDGLESQR